MALGSDRTAGGRDTLLFLICLALSVAARGAPREWAARVSLGFQDTLLRPFLLLQNESVLIKSSQTRFDEVVAERDSLVLAADSLAALRMENEQLREVVGLKNRLPVSYVQAEVLRQATPMNDYTVTLSAGRAQGVRPQAPVLAPKGLFGVIQQVGANTSVAMLWGHPEFRASAMTLDGSVFGIIAPYGSKGPNEMLMELSGIPYREDIPAGAAVYTSGLGDVYPKGIALGTILQVGSEGEGWSRTYLVRPIVHPAGVTHVVILMPGSQGDLRATYKPAAP